MFLGRTGYIAGLMRVYIVDGLTQGHFARYELGMLLSVSNGSYWNTPVGKGSPKVGAHEIISPLI